MNDLFTDTDVISCYSWDDAVADGMFVEITGLAKALGFKIPTAITQSVFSYCNVEGNERLTNNNIVTLLLSLHGAIKKQTENSNHLNFRYEFDEGFVTEVWATIEGRNPKNPEPVMTIMLPEDY